MKDKLKYTTVFSSEIKPVVSEERDKYLALASMIEVAKFLPDVDVDKQVDLLPIAFNAFVANRVNRNGDVVDTETAIAFYKDFKNKPINIEHNREKVIGTILTAGFSEFGTDKPLTEEEVSKMEGPFNVTLGAVIWKMVNKGISNLIEESADPSSDSYMKVSASWELGFTEYNLVLLEGNDKNIENGTLIDDEEEVEALENNLKALGGEGRTEDGKFIYRKVVGEVVPLGIGLTETPAADVKGLATEKTVLSSEKEEEENFAEVDKTSQIQQDIVINQNEEKIMKIESIKDITDESLKQLSASAVSDYIESELKEASERFSAEKHQVEKDLGEAQEKISTVSSEYEKIKVDLDSVSEKLKTLESEKAKKEAEELFNQRMASLDETYALENEDREVIAEQVKDLDEESWESFAKRISVLLRDKSREVLAKKEAETQAKENEVKEEKDEQEEKTEESKASEDIVDEAIDRGEEDAEVVPASTNASETSTYDKYKNAFSVEQFDIKY
jgi:septum formation inhibitor MinC